MSFATFFALVISVRPQSGEPSDSDSIPRDLNIIFARVILVGAHQLHQIDNRAVHVLNQEDCALRSVDQNYDRVLQADGVAPQTQVAELLKLA